VVKKESALSPIWNWNVVYRIVDAKSGYIISDEQPWRGAHPSDPFPLDAKIDKRGTLHLITLTACTSLSNVIQRPSMQISPL